MEPPTRRRCAATALPETYTCGPDPARRRVSGPADFCADPERGSGRGADPGSVSVTSVACKPRFVIRRAYRPAATPVRQPYRRVICWLHKPLTRLGPCRHAVPPTPRECRNQRPTANKARSGQLASGKSSGIPQDRPSWLPCHFLKPQHLISNSSILSREASPLYYRTISLVLPNYYNP